MSDEVISIEEVIVYSLDTIPGLIIWFVYKDRSRRWPSTRCSRCGTR